jgi:CDP-diacylglycerol---glycerol-3-phosphate 3-phosphatidyltransferase
MPLPLLSFAVILGLALLSMLVFALIRGQRDSDADVKSAQFLGGFGDFLLQWWFFFVVAPLTRLSLRLGLTPNALSYIALAFGGVAGVCFALGWIELGAWMMILSGVWDMLDGRVARATGRTTRYGAFIDAVLDRFIEFFMFVGLAYLLRGTALGALATSAALGGSLLVSYARAAGESIGVDCTGGLMQRGERLLLICLTCLTDRTTTAWMGLPFGTTVIWALLLIGVASLGTSVYRTVWIARRLAAPVAPDATHKDA